MNPHSREQTLFAQALDLDPAGRAAFLDRECDGEPALRARLEALLAANSVNTDFLPNQPRTLSISPEDLPGEQPGERIGRYKLLERVGEGGCGVVYVAEQTEPVRRRVALKVIKLGMDTKAVVARFEAERQALAMMDHPNIAKVLDAGASERGRPYFVMELVRGIPITHYCDQNSLSTEARLGLFIQVCQAIQHAHQKGIIHRDIKPSNILVTVNDGVPVPKVIDFGIAKATEGRLTDATIYTQLHQFIGTPAYMSPEQAEMTSLDIDTRSDIYSLGVLLYELLAGRTPFEAKELMAAGLDAMRRMVREQEPARPSTRLATLQGEELSTTAKRRSTEPPKLLRQLQGDLDWIVMKCLEKDRTRRYETANGLAADLQRHLGNEPVVARPPSTAYRIQKAWRRNRTAFAVAGLIALVLVAATVFSAWQAHRAREAQAEATARAEAERAAREDAEALAGFLGEVFRSPDPGRDGRTITVAETLAGAARQLETDLAGQPERRAILQTALAETYLGLSLFREATPLLEQVLLHHRTRLGDLHTNTIHAISRLAVAHYGLGRLDVAMSLREEALELRTRLQGREDPETVQAMMVLADTYRWFLSKGEEESSLRSEAAAIRRKQQELEPGNTLEKLVERTYVNTDAPDLTREEIVTIFEEILQRTIQEKGPQHPATIAALANLAGQMPFTRGLEKVRRQEEAVALSRRINGPEHQSTVSYLGNLAWYQIGVGQINEALHTLEEVVPLSLKTHGPDHLGTLSYQMKLAEVYAQVGRVDEGIELAEGIMPRFEQVSGDMQTLWAMNMLANVYLFQADGGRSADAIRWFERAAASARKHVPGTHAAIHHIEALASGFNRVRRHDDAAALYDELEPMVREVLGEEGMHTAGWMGAVGRGYAEAGKPEKAIPVLRNALRLCTKFFGSADRNTVLTFNTLHRALLQTGHLGEALELTKTVSEVLANDPESYGATSALAAALFEAGRPEEAMETFEVASSGNPPNPETALDLAVLQLWRGDVAGYERTRTRLLAREPDLADPRRGGWIARFASLRDFAGPAEAERALALARRTVEAGCDHAHLPWFLLCLGMAEYRAGLIPDAERTLQEAARAGSRFNPHNHLRMQGIARFYQAMCQFRQGRVEEARTLFQETESATRPLPVDGGIPALNQIICNDLILAIACDEARRLVMGEPTP